MTDTRIEIEGRDDAVVLRLLPMEGKEQFVALSPDQAIEIAQCIMKYAGSAKYGGETLAKKTAIETTRKILVPRVVHIIRNLQDRQKSPEYIAAEVVDRVIGEML